MQSLRRPQIGNRSSPCNYDCRLMQQCPATSRVVSIVLRKGARRTKGEAGTSLACVWFCMAWLYSKLKILPGHIVVVPT